MPSLTIRKSFIRPHLDYRDIIYDQAYNVLFLQKIEYIQYNSMTGIIRGTSTEKGLSMVWKPSKKEDGTRNYAVSIKFI